MVNQKGQPSYFLRQATMDDFEFLYKLHVQTLRPYVEALWGWEEAWQREYFERKFDPQKYKIIQIEGRDAGVLAVKQGEGKTHIELLEIMPDFQKRGVGTAVINDICSQAFLRNHVVTLNVLKSNIPARRLYERLGFTKVREEEYRIEMIRKIQ
jgi:ribosomal protein S18 acetylase RimI-like enzyme